MRVWMGKVTVGVVFTEEEAEQVRKHLGDRIQPEFDFRERTLVLRAPLKDEGGSAIYNRRTTAGKTPPPGKVVQWGRSYINAERWPTFGQTAVERVAFTPGRIRAVLPDEKDRASLKRWGYKRQKSEIPTSTFVPAPVPSSTVRIMDTLEQLRSYVKKLNDVREKHPENITFKVKVDGKLGFEFLADE